MAKIEIQNVITPSSMSFRSNRWLVYPAFALPFVALGIYLWKYTVNAPYYDDFIWGFGLIDKLTNSNSWEDKFRILFSYHNEHRIVWTHFVFYTQYLLTHHLNFQILTYIGNLPLLIIPFLFWKSIPHNTTIPRSAWFIIILLLILQPQCYHNIFTTYGLANHYAILSILGIIYGLIYHPKFFLATLLLAFLGTFTTGVGVLGWLLGASVLLIKRQTSRLSLWILCTIICLVFYFKFGENSISNELVRSKGSLGTWLANMLLYIPAFCFSIVEFGQFGSTITRKIAMFLGVSFFIGLFILALKYNERFLSKQLVQKFWKERSTILPNYLFLGHSLALVLATGFLASIKRTNADFLDWGIPDHYRIYSQLFIVCVFVISIYFFQDKKMWLSVFGASLLFFLVSYYITTPRIVNLSNQLKADSHNYATNGFWALYPSYVKEGYYLNANTITKKVMTQNIWKPQKLNVDDFSRASIQKIFFDNNSQNIVLQYQDIPASAFVLYETPNRQQLLLPVQVKFSTPSHAFRYRTAIQREPKSILNQWFWQKFAKSI